MADCVGVGLLQNFHFRNFTKFREIFNFMFRKIRGKFRENEIKNFVKISRNYKNEISQQPYAGVE